jgi:hypothetical protein
MGVQPDAAELFRLQASIHLFVEFDGAFALAQRVALHVDAWCRSRSRRTDRL